MVLYAVGERKKYVYECLDCKKEIYRTGYEEKHSLQYCSKCSYKYKKTNAIYANEEGKKKCNICQRMLPVSTFIKRRNKTFSSACSKCHNLKKFGINSIEYEEMLEKQGGVCAICGNKEPCNDKNQDYKRALAVDHCHETSKVRGLLCTHCNTGIGALKDDVEILEKAIQYLKNSKL